MTNTSPTAYPPHNFPDPFDQAALNAANREHRDEHIRLYDAWTKHNRDTWDIIGDLDTRRGETVDELNWCKHALAHAEKTGWTEGVEHYRYRVLATEYEAWAAGDLSEISDDAMCYGSEKYRQAHPEICDPGPPLGRAAHGASVGEGERT